MLNLKAVVDILNDVYQPAFVIDNNNKVVWKNESATNLFADNDIESNIRNYNFIRKSYNTSAEIFEICFQNNIETPVRFTFHKFNTYQIFIACLSNYNNANTIKNGTANFFTSIIKDEVAKSIRDIDTISKEINASHRPSTKKISTLISLMKHSLKKIETRTEDAKKLISSNLGFTNSNERILINDINNYIIERLKKHNLLTTISLMNNEYGVIYSDVYILSHTLANLIYTSLDKFTDTEKTNIRVLQEANNITWSWKTSNINDAFFNYYLYMWNALGGEISLNESYGNKLVTASFPSGGVIKYHDRELSTWAENQYLTLIDAINFD